MIQPDFERAKRYALERLARELSPDLVYHSAVHTRDDVVPAVERLAALAGVQADALLLLRTAACYHDIGFVEGRTEHEASGARIVAEVLPGFGYGSAHIMAIGGMILATKLPQSPNTGLEEILADADLDVLGREDFFARNQDLRTERAAPGMLAGDEEWYGDQLKFLQTHHYFTAAARALRNAGKQRNIEAMTKLLAECQGQRR